MNARRNIFLAIIVWLACSSVLASDGYRCTLRQALTLSEDGRLVEGRVTDLYMKMNKEFVVDQATGRIIGGAGLSNHNECCGSPAVIDKGSSRQSFKALTIYKPLVAVDYLEIQEFKESMTKPFILLSAGTLVFSGVCKRF